MSWFKRKARLLKAKANPELLELQEFESIGINTTEILKKETLRLCQHGFLHFSGACTKIKTPIKKEIPYENTLLYTAYFCASCFLAGVSYKEKEACRQEINARKTLKEIKEQSLNPLLAIRHMQKLQGIKDNLLSNKELITKTSNLSEVRAFTLQKIEKALEKIHTYLQSDACKEALLVKCLDEQPALKNTINTVKETKLVLLQKEKKETTKYLLTAITATFKIQNTTLNEQIAADQMLLKCPLEVSTWLKHEASIRNAYYAVSVLLKEDTPKIIETALGILGKNEKDNMDLEKAMQAARLLIKKQAGSTE